MPNIEDDIRKAGKRRRAAQLRNMVRTAENKAAAKRQNEAHMRRRPRLLPRPSSLL